jgi:hypothetical protein
MLGSITPLGERGRGMRWGVTVGWLIVGAALGGAFAGAAVAAAAALARVGSVSSMAREYVLVVIVLVAAVLDVSRRIPTVHRQVNDSWMYAYRGWAYGFGFGTQLGLGTVTVISTAGTYAVFLAAGLVASPAAAIVGATYGLARGMPVVATASVKDLRGLVAVERWLRRAEAPARWLTIGAYLALGVALLAQAAG